MWYTGHKVIDIMLLVFYIVIAIGILSTMGETSSSGLEDKSGPDF